MSPNPVPDQSGQTTSTGLSLAPFRGLRPTVDDARLGALLCPPYDVIDERTRRELLKRDGDNAVAVILPEPSEAGYADAAARLLQWVDAGLLAADETPALYVYEMREPDGHAMRGLLGAVELRAPDDGVILPHENTMAGPVADRLAVMTATQADLEPIYLVYDGGGVASGVVRDIDSERPVATATTPDGVTHRLWAVRDPSQHDAIDGDLATRSALIADGHHRYATYRERQRLERERDGAGPWDRGLALLVDTSDYGPQVHAIHRVVHGIGLDDAIAGLAGFTVAEPVDDLADAVAGLSTTEGFRAVLTDGTRSVAVDDTSGALAATAAGSGDAVLAELDVTIVHRVLVEKAWQLPDDEATIGYAHSVSEAIDDARAAGGFAVLLRPTPIASVAAVAAAGARMPRKSTLFTPKPASGLVMRRLADQSG